jgi:HK97 family phage portal protein
MSWFNPFSWGKGAGNSRKQGFQSEGPLSYNSKTAAPVTFDSAMTVPAYWACVKLLSETISAMPINAYVTNEDGSRAKDSSNKLWRTLNYQPNRYQTRTEFFETKVLNLVTNGNAYSLISRNARGQIVSLIPLMSSQMCVELQLDGSIKYIYTNANSERIIYTEKQIWHVKLFGNGIVGMASLAYGASQLGISIATDNRVSKIASNGGKVSGILSIDNVLTDVQRKAVRDNMKDIAEGDTDTLKILEAGMDFQQVALSPQDMQLLESRRFNVEQTCRIMGVPSVLVNDTAGSTVWGSGIQEIVRGFYKTGLLPIAERFESSIKRHLMPSNDWDTVDIEFDFDLYLRPSYEDRVKANSLAINSGQLTPNEARNKEGLEDKEGGDDIYLNGTLEPAGSQELKIDGLPEDEILKGENLARLAEKIKGFSNENDTP